MSKARLQERKVYMESFRVCSHGAGDTVRIASILASKLFEGDVVLLKGELASGKTTFVKAVAAALGSPDPVTSPTFSLAQFYSSEAGSVLHVDAYRLANVLEYRDLGLEEYAETSISLVEWGEKITEEFPCHLLVELRQDVSDPNRRELVFSSSGERWALVLSGLRDEIAREVA
ncbi:MAG: tRNA (adenosine(37)-N6)-threonylcarbamoyltransferase complex ATPase subunit type 1 TsaE [Pseudonocardiales bacterium]|nr:tRNA (adenosine(37)-N6)-threonylcarbamoyltransferase complex ATPase subunit type 1 TsaE [Pseudonocardiales bacterium]MBV9028757.1 tRNA (adenosine(37)-N6)-threonylcarbamoyltransferase complex ATPase subunit type 1 TsaE [Pseudonocardiales bacterium]MBW0011138.1 tRNA (adenosine(37)-N6)-threonylcarbamoyltransferase complex ATPase subunit type 1 TsaE [Pseudonocardiales bacterium]